MQIKQKKGFTLVELLVVITLFTTVMILTSGIYSRFSASERKLRTENELYEETRFTLERISKEFREGTIDYEEYWNQANVGNCTLYSSGATTYEESYGKYGNCYKAYAQQFYNTGSLSTGTNPSDPFSLPEDANAVSATGASIYNQEELYIINNAGNQKTLLRRVEDAEGQGKLQILTLNGYDIGYDNGATTITATQNDGVIDTWVCAKDYTCSGTISDGTSAGEILGNNNDGWTDYSPSSLDITALKFFIAPLEDPRKAYNENTDGIQMQPHITVLISAQTAQKKAMGLPGKTPTVTLQTTVSGRVFNEVK